MKIYHYNGACNCSGKRIKLMREKLGISQEQLAAKMQILGLDISQRTISRVETGLRVVPDYELSFFACALGVSILWLLGEDENN
ncbi:MAG: helix-turn-helix transcriptional regulator [Clostridia bacterium]|nr:helix-turn-helix transcriptional regulator [Clostridia bacterium]